MQLVKEAPDGDHWPAKYPAIVAAVAALPERQAYLDEWGSQSGQINVGHSAAVEFVDDDSASFQSASSPLGPRNSSEQQRQRFSSGPPPRLRRQQLRSTPAQFR